MPNRRRAGFVSSFYNPLQVPNAPTGVSATAGNASATVSFTAPGDVGGGAISAYYALSNTGVWATGSSSPISVSGLTNGSSYTFQVWALNAFGPSPYSGASGSVTPDGSRAVFAGGIDASDRLNVIEYVTIVTTGNSIDFGDLSTVAGTFGELYQLGGGVASTTRGLFAGGLNRDGGDTQVNVIQYITIASVGNATDFGDLLSATSGNPAGCSSDTRGLWAGGAAPGTTNIISYVTIASLGNATDFGDLTQARASLGGCSSSTRGVFGGGSSPSNVIDYVTIASTGDATDFGDLTVARNNLGACSTSVRGVWAGGSTGGSNVNNIIDYVTIASTGNATDFGDLTVERWRLSGSSNSTRGVFGGGRGYLSPYYNTIDYITIATTGNATDFGDLLQAKMELASVSNGHGGLQ